MYFTPEEAADLDKFYFDMFDKFIKGDAEDMIKLSKRDKVGLLILMLTLLRTITWDGIDPRAMLAVERLLDVTSDLAEMTGIEPPGVDTESLVLYLMDNVDKDNTPTWTKDHGTIQ